MLRDPHRTDDLTANEVAVLSDVPPRMVRKAVEDRVLAWKTARTAAKRRRMLGRNAVIYFTVLRAIDLPLPKEGKIRVARWIDRAAGGGLTGHLVVHGPLTLDIGKLAPEIRRRRAQTDSYRRARDRWIIASEGIKGGTPVIKGTRMTVYSVLGRVEGGDTIAEIAAENPDVPPEALEAAVIFARANPMRGRPSGRPWNRTA